MLIRKLRVIAPVLCLALLFPGLSRADLVVSDDWIDFGEVEIDDEGAESFEVTNTGSRSVDDIDVDLYWDWSIFDYSTDCDFGLAPGMTCTVDVYFRPDAVGDFTAEILVESSAGSVTVDLEGEGIRSDSGH